MNLIQLSVVTFVLINPSHAQTGGDVSAPQVVAPAQPVTAVTNATTGVAAVAQPAQPGMFGMAMPFLIMLAVMYFLMIRPNQKRAKAQQALLSGLQTGDEVVTSAGILGTITGMSDKVVTLEIFKNVQMKVLKSQVNQIVKGTIPDLQP